MPKKAKNVNTPKTKTNSVSAKSVSLALEKLYSSRSALPPPMAKKSKNKKKSSNSSSVHLSRCALKYALATTNPFDPKCIGVCYPGNNYGISQKVRVIQRGEITVGTSGCWFLGISPCIANDAIAIWLSTNAYAGAATSNVGFLSANNTLETGCTTQNMSSLPYSSAQLCGQSSNASAGQFMNTGRVVAVGARTSYSGTMQTMGGVNYCLCTDDHQSVSGMAQPDIAAFQNMNIEANDREPCMLTWSPCNSTERDYYENSTTLFGSTANVIPACVYANYPILGPNFAATYDGATQFSYSQTLNSQTVNTPPPCMIINGSGATAGQTVHYEIIFHVEYAGRLANVSATPNASDPAGASLIDAAQKTLSMRKFDQPHKSAWTHMVEAIRSVWNELKPVILPAAESALASLL